MIDVRISSLKSQLCLLCDVIETTRASVTLLFSNLTAARIGDSSARFGWRPAGWPIYDLEDGHE